jgi:hypothetical protein
MIETNQMNRVERDTTKCCPTIDSFPEKTMGHPVKRDKDKAINAAGHSVLKKGANGTEFTSESQGLLSKQTFSVKPYLFGISTAAGVIGFYLGLLTLVSDWNYASSQFAHYGGWILALAASLGIQATLFSYIRNRLKDKTTTAAKTSLAGSGGISAASMAVCCAHYLVAFLPAFGLSFFSSVAAGLAKYQEELLFLAVISNIFAIVVLIKTMNNNGLIPAGFFARIFTIGL